jgi:DNA invertase Pin-like site-specific DNA recombinase
MKIGYARLPDASQNSQIQVDELKKFGCKTIFQDIQSECGSRPELEKMMVSLHKGDIVVVGKLDRIGKSLDDLISLFDSFRSKEIEFVSLHDHIDTTEDKGSFFKTMVSLSEFESKTRSDRIKAGLSAARIHGRKGGRPKGLSEQSLKIAREAEAFYRNGNMPVTEIAGELGIGKTTLYRYLHYMDENLVQKRGGGIRESDKINERKKLRKELFNKLAESKAFWSYSNVNYEGISDDMLIQKVLIHLEIEDIKDLFTLYNRNHIRSVWKTELVIQDTQYRSLNLLLAKLFFNIKKPESYIKRVNREYLRSISV